MSTGTSWPPPSSQSQTDVESIPLSLPSLTAATDLDANNVPSTKATSVESPLHSKVKYQQQLPLHSQDTTLKQPTAITSAREDRVASSDSNRPAARATSTGVNSARNQQQLVTIDVARQVERPTGNPQCIVRIDRDHNLGDEATRFECEQFPQEFIDRVTRSQFKGTVEGVNKCMEDAEESLLNFLDTLLDCLTAYTAKYCFGTHYQRALRRMEEFIDQQNRTVYHPARMHLRDPQKVGMIYLEFEIF
ncbi:Golgin sub A member 7 [Haplosporangium sp. Z 27]|nr:Golgin sub A member 7 [Haplosporangium sp. Z 27]